MRIYLFVTILMLGGATLALAQGDADRQLSAQRDMCLDGSIDTAEQRIAACNNAIGSNWYQGRDLARLYFSRSTLFDEKGDSTSGLNDLDAALHAWRGIVNNVINRSVKYLHEKKYDIAVADLNHAAELFPDSYPILADRAAAHLHRGDLDAAARDDAAALALKPDGEAAIMIRGLVEARQGNIPAALKDFEYIQQREPRSEDAFNASCYTRALAKLDIESRALPDCEKAVALAPQSANARDSRGYVYFLLGRWEAAIADYDAALAIDPKKAASLYGRGLAKKQKGDVAGGDNDIAAAEALLPGIGAKFGTFEFYTLRQ
jgi:tetratricopeptide (TPR) repeat protein